MIRQNPLFFWKRNEAARQTLAIWQPGDQLFAWLTNAGRCWQSFFINLENEESMIKLTRRGFNGMIGTALLAETFAATWPALPRRCCD